MPAPAKPQPRRGERKQPRTKSMTPVRTKSWVSKKKDPGPAGTNTPTTTHTHSPDVTKVSLAPSKPASDNQRCTGTAQRIHDGSSQTEISKGRPAGAIGRTRSQRDQRTRRQNDSGGARQSRFRNYKDRYSSAASNSLIAASISSFEYSHAFRSARRSSRVPRRKICSTAAFLSACFLIASVSMGRFFPRLPSSRITSFRSSSFFTADRPKER
jgi:hypothetical protein